VLKHIRRTSPARSALLGGAQGNEKAKDGFVCAARTYFFIVRGGRALLAGLGFGVLGFDLHPLCAAE
jgi:hypothetical protein